MTASHNTDDPVTSDATEVRFSMRALLVLTAIGAVASASLGAFIRRFPADARPRLVVFWGILAVAMAAITLFLAWRRRRAERNAGHVILQLVRHSYFFPRQPTWALNLAGALSLAIAPAMWVMGSFIIAKGVPPVWWSFMNYGTIYSLFMSGAGITFFWWRRIRLCENGVVVRNRFLPWTACQHWYWDACYKNALVMEFNRYGRLAVNVPAEERSAAEAILKST